MIGIAAAEAVAKTSREKAQRRDEHSGILQKYSSGMLLQNSKNVRVNTLKCIFNVI